jgi:hypothetical protein
MSFENNFYWAKYQKSFTQQTHFSLDAKFEVIINKMVSQKDEI